MTYFLTFQIAAGRYWTGASDQTSEGMPTFELGSLGALTLSAGES